MAGHLPLDKNNPTQLLLILEIQKFVNGQKIDQMTPFERYKKGDLIWQRLTDRNEENDAHVLSVYPWTFKFDDGEVCVGAIAEIHFAADMSINTIYMVM